MTVYTTYEAKAKFSELLRKVRSGQRVVISYRGQEVAQIVPIPTKASLAQSIQGLEDEGVLSPGKKPAGQLKPIASRPGALARFLESRD